MSSLNFRYPTPDGRARIELVVEKSRFIATISETRTVDAARAFISAIKVEFPDASHHVYAFRIGYGNAITEGTTDDGEPPGTAGRPILAVVRGADLGDVALVVVRYFGGTKLGTGGLVKAYTEAAQQALRVVSVSERVVLREGLLPLPYAWFEPTRTLITKHGGCVQGEDFGSDVVLEIKFPVDRIAAFEAELTELSGGRLQPLWFEED